MFHLSFYYHHPCSLIYLPYVTSFLKDYLWSFVVVFISCFSTFCNKDSLLQSELENLSFLYTNAHDYSELKQRAEELYKEQEKEIEEVLFISLITIFLML